MDMIALLVLVLSWTAAAQRGHYIVDYQRLPLYQEFYLSPGLYRPLFPGRQEAGAQEARSEEPVAQQPGPQEQPSVAEEAVVVGQEQAQLQPQQQVASLPTAPVLKYSNSMTHDGSYSYKYETADGLTREESSVMEPAADGQLVASVKGSYSYPGPDGRIIRVDYVADQDGFRATGDHLPASLADSVYNFKYVVP